MRKTSLNRKHGKKGNDRYWESKEKVRMKIDKSLLQAAYTTDSEADGLYAVFDVMGQIKVLSLRQEGLIIRTLRLEPRLLAGSSQRHRSFEISKDTSDSAEEQYGSWVKTEIREMEDRVNWVSRCSFSSRSHYRCDGV